jgi:hypothetical protein
MLSGRLTDFGARTIRVAKMLLRRTKAATSLSSSCVTAAGSRAGFIHKLWIVLKELNEEVLAWANRGFYQDSARFRQSDLRFRISDLRCRIHPISRFQDCPNDL